MKIIHSRLLLALSALLLAACSQPKDKFIFEGKIAGIQQAEFYVYSDDGALSGVDTIRIDDGKFSYECQLTSPAVLTLLYPNFSQTYIVAEPGKTIEMKGDAAKLGEADITGSEENELLTDSDRSKTPCRKTTSASLPLSLSEHTKKHWRQWQYSRNISPTRKLPKLPPRVRCSKTSPRPNRATPPSR